MPSQIRTPGDILGLKTRFFGRFTAGDLARISLPLLAAVLATSGSVTGRIPGIAAATLVSVAWYGWRPYDRPLDHHIANIATWGVERIVEEDTTFEARGDAFIDKNSDATVGVIKITPTNIGMKSTEEQMALHETYRQLLTTVNYPIEIHSRQRQASLKPYIQQIKSRDGMTELRNAYAEHCRELSNGEITSTTHYITVRVERNSFTWIYRRLRNHLPLEEEQREEDNLRSELDSRCNEIISLLNTADLSAERLTQPDLPTPIEYDEAYLGSQFYRKNLDSDYRKTVSITELPSNTELAWPVSLLRVDGTVDITQVIEPRDTGDTARKLQRILNKLNAEIDSLLHEGYSGTNHLERLLDDTEWLLDLIADREDQPVNYSCYITAHAQDKNDCSQTLEQIYNRLDTMQYGYTTPVFQTGSARKTTSLIHPNRLNQSLLLPGRSAAAGFPFGTQNTDQDSNGVVYGTDTNDKTPVLLDRFSWRSHSMARMGATGSGKSYATKLELIRSRLAYPDLKIIVIDPKKEYTPLIKQLGGTVHTLEKDTEYSFNDSVIGLEIAERVAEDNRDALVNAVRQTYDAVSRDTEKTLVAIDEAHNLMNYDAGREVLNQFILEARDTQTAVTLISQNASHFTEWRQGREILDNMPGKVFMRHERVPDSVTDYFNLSTRESQNLYNLKTGNDAAVSEGIVKVSGQIDTRTQIESTNEEDTLIKAGENR